MSTTSVRIKGDTYRMIIKNRGLFEQIFKRKLSLDDTVYLSSRLISFIYETFQKLEAQNLIEIKEAPDGSIKIEGLEKSMNTILPDAINEFTDINEKLKEKEKEASRLAVTIRR